MATHKEQLDQETQERIAESIQKNKKETTKAVDKAKADLRNQVTDAKNELAKARADWQRERKKIAGDHEEAVSTLQSELLLARDVEVRAARDKIEKTWRKRLEDLEREQEVKSA